MDRRTFLSMLSATLASTPQNRENAQPTDSLAFAPRIWSDGQLFAFSAIDGPTSYADGIVARSTLSPIGLQLVTPGLAGVRFGKVLNGEARLTNDLFVVPTENGVTRGAYLDAFHILIDGPCAVDHLGPEIETKTADSRTLIGAKSRFNSALIESPIDIAITQRAQWLKKQSLPPDLTRDRERTLHKALCIMKGQVNSPEGLIHHRWTTPDRWPHRDLWLWDSVFHALGWRHLDLALARETLEAIFDGQQPDGRIPHQLSPTKFSAVTQPPLLAFGVQQLAETPPDGAWIERCYPHLKRYLEWDFENRVGSGELAHWLIDPNPQSRSGESGMDNSPRFDGATRLYAVDFNSYLSLECEVMSKFATLLNRPAEANDWRARHDKLNASIQKLLWNDEAGFFFDYDPERAKQTGIFAVSGFLPLLCGACTTRQTDRLAAKLDDPDTFGTKVKIASAVTPGHPSGHDMWRGPVWINMNWLVAHGFERSGNASVAAQLHAATMQEIERWYRTAGYISEFYDEQGITNPELLPRKGTFDPTSPMHQSIHDYGWTATLYTDLVFKFANENTTEVAD